MDTRSQMKECPQEGDRSTGHHCVRGVARISTEICIFPRAHGRKIRTFQRLADTENVLSNYEATRKRTTPRSASVKSWEHMSDSERRKSKVNSHLRFATHTKLALLRLSDIDREMIMHLYAQTYEADDASAHAYMIPASPR